MRKIPSLYLRDWAGNRNLVTREPNPECDWVFAGEGVATRKWDGTACMVRGGKLFKRYELKPWKTPPPDFEAAQARDEETGKTTGWVPVGDRAEDQYHREYFKHVKHILNDGTYELVGPKIQGNPDDFDSHILLRHGDSTDTNVPRDYDGLQAFLADRPIEGIVWHHADGRMAKVKRRDFGLEWPIKPVLTPEIMEGK